jgi:hypothetical protein
MGLPNVFNILKSGATVYYAPVGEALPDPAVIGAGDAWGGNWEQIGATKEPVALKYTTDEHSSEVEEFLGPVRRWRIKEELALETVMAELTADYLGLAVNEAASLAGSSVPYDELIVGNITQLDELAWGFEGILCDATNTKTPVRFFIPRGTAKLNGDLKFSRRDDDYTGVPLQVNGLADVDDAIDPGRMFVFQRVPAIGSGS